jgi:hypothetical protein|tara:strand:+ start:1362 stop:1547 length:186 start_codon:yes stop_codon:yes gene_type:complete
MRGVNYYIDPETHEYVYLSEERPSQRMLEQGERSRQRWEYIHLYAAAGFNLRDLPEWESTR